MQTDQTSLKWELFQREGRSRWSRLTADDWKQADGDAARLAGKLQERYGNTEEAAYKEIDALINALG